MFSNIQNDIEMIKKFFISMFKGKETMPIKKVTNQQVVDALVDQCNVDMRRINWVLTDAQYNVLTREELTAIVQSTKINEIVYVADTYDCDNYSLALASKMSRFAAGMIHVKYNGTGDVDAYHAINFAFLSDGKIVFIEPQTDEIFAPNKDYQIYFVYC